MQDSRAQRDRRELERLPVSRDVLQVARTTAPCPPDLVGETGAEHKDTPMGGRGSAGMLGAQGGSPLPSQEWPGSTRLTCTGGYGQVNGESPVLKSQPSFGDLGPMCS